MSEFRNVKRFSIVIFLLTIFVFNIDNAFNQTRNIYRRSDFQPGDAVRVSVIEIALQGTLASAGIDINADYQIARDGTIYMPLIGKLKVVGHNQESLTQLIAEKYSAYFNEPFITVTPLIRIVLMGAFNRPGSYYVNPEASLWELIDMADGPSVDCDLNSIEVKRMGKVAIKDLLSSFEKGHSLKEIGVRSGDQIHADTIDKMTIRDIMDYSRFIISIVNLYLLIDRLN